MSTPSQQFAIAGRSTLEDAGLHHLGQYGGFQPWEGGCGRLSEERCRDLIRRFDSEAEALAEAARLRAAGSHWAVWIVPDPLHVS